MPASTFATVTTLCVVPGCKYKQTIFYVIIFTFTQGASIICATLFFGRNILFSYSI